MTDEEIITALEDMASESETNFSASVVDLIRRQKAEIERLTKDKSFATRKMMESKAKTVELQKKVDWLKKDREAVFNEMSERMKAEVAIEKKLGVRKCEQAVKDTAEKYYRKMRLALGILCFGNDKIHKENSEIAKQFGVEIEQDGK